MFTNDSQEADWSPILCKLHRGSVQSSIHIFENASAWTQRTTQVAKSAHFCMQVIDFAIHWHLPGYESRTRQIVCLKRTRKKLHGMSGKAHSASVGLWLSSKINSLRILPSSLACERLTIVLEYSFFANLNLMKTKASPFTGPYWSLHINVWRRHGWSSRERNSGRRVSCIAISK